MHIRIQGRQVQCIRTIYDKGQGRGTSKVVLTFPIPGAWESASVDAYVPADKRTGLAMDEQVTLSMWIQSMNRSWTVESNTQAVTGTLANINRCVDVLAGNTIPDDVAAKLWTASLELQKALKKSGHSKPKTQDEPAPAPTVV